MNTPKDSTLKDYTAAVRAASPNLRNAPEADLQLVVGLVLRLVGTYLTSNKQQLLLQVKEQLRLRQWTWLQIWLISKVISIVIDILVDWFLSGDGTLQNKASQWMPSDLPILLTRKPRG